MKLFIFLFLALYQICLANQVLLQWKPVTNAKIYKVEVLNIENKQIIKTETTKPEIKIKLSPGTYSFRIGAIENQNLNLIWSEWQNLNVSSEKTIHISLDFLFQSPVFIESKFRNLFPFNYGFSLGSKFYFLRIKWFIPTLYLSYFDFNAHSTQLKSYSFILGTYIPIYTYKKLEFSISTLGGYSLQILKNISSSRRFDELELILGLNLTYSLTSRLQTFLGFDGTTFIDRQGTIFFIIPKIGASFLF